MSHKPSFFDMLDPYRMAYKVESNMVSKAVKAPLKVFLLAIMAGVFIGLGFVYCSLANVSGAGKIVGGLVFSTGLLLVVVFGADLFTSSTMTLISKANKQITWRQMFLNWGIVFCGNFIGAMILVGVILMSGHPFDNGGSVGLFYIITSEHKLSHTFLEAVGLGILCNIMVCLAVCMSYAGRSLADKLVAVLLPVGLFIACGFEHSVANMFMVPVGIYTNKLASPELLAQLSNPEHYRQILTWKNFIFANLIPVSIGNIIGGGVMIGLYQWLIYLRPGVEREHQAPVKGEMHSLEDLLIREAQEDGGAVVQENFKSTIK